MRGEAHARGLDRRAHDTHQMLVAGRVRIISAAWRIVSACGRGSDGGSADAYRDTSTHGCATINATAIDATVMDANATNADTSAICEGIR